MVITGHGEIDTAIEAIKLGAVNYLPKPINMDELLIALERAMETLRFKNKIMESEKKLRLANKILESRVEQRTSDLLKKVSELRLLAEVFKNSSDSIVITDHDGNIVKVNPGFCKLTGYSREEARWHITISLWVWQTGTFFWIVLGWHSP
jgi:PAS domain-containing protein